MKTDELATLTPQVVSLSIRGEDKPIEVAPFKWGQFVTVVSHIEALKAGIVKALPEGEDNEIHLTSINLLALVAAHGKEVSSILCLATGKSGEFIDSLDVDDVVRLIGAVLEVNRDFFSRLLAPALREAMSRLSVGAM